MELKITRFAKSIVYAATAIIIAIAGVALHNNLHTNWDLSAYFLTDGGLFVLGSIITGTAVYSYRSYTKSHREHVLDSIYLGAVGAFYLLAFLVILFTFGGIKDTTFYEHGSVPANINIIMISAAPIPFMVRSAILAASNQNTKKQKIIAFSVVGGIMVIYIVLLFTGNLFKMVRLGV